MNFYDILVLGFVALFVINGFRKGFIISLATIVALVIGIWAAIHFSNYFDEFLLRNLNTGGKWIPLISFSVTFLLVMIAVFLIAKMVEKLIDLVGMGFLNRLGGALLGLVKGALLASIILFILFKADPGQKWITPEDKKSSITLTWVETLFPKFMKVIGDELHFPV
jgi:membrane protein required for colicin V production